MASFLRGSGFPRSAAEDGETPSDPRYRIVGGVAVFAVFFSCALVLVINGQFDVRPSADTTETQPLWVVWAAPIAGVVALVMCPPRRMAANTMLTDGRRRRVTLEGVALVVLAAGFASALAIVGSGNSDIYSLMKGVLLLAVPGILFALTRRRYGRLASSGLPVSGWWALAPVAVWAAVGYATPLAPSAADVTGLTVGTAVLLLIGGFVVNAVTEEVFYRRWLQTRLESLLGISVGVGWSTVLWSVWHAGIQGVGRVEVDLAAAVANHAPMGVFLGLLWVRYRRMWPLLTVHGLLNAVPVVLGLAS